MPLIKSFQNIFRETTPHNKGLFSTDYRCQWHLLWGEYIKKSLCLTEDSKPSSVTQEIIKLRGLGRFRLKFSDNDQEHLKIEHEILN